MAFVLNLTLGKHKMNRQKLFIEMNQLIEKFNANKNRFRSDELYYQVMAERAIFKATNNPIGYLASLRIYDHHIDEMEDLRSRFLGLLGLDGIS